MMKSIFTHLNKPINLAKLCRGNQRRQRREVLSTILMLMMMMIVAGFRHASATSR
ncbi:hypothetical protein OPS25_11060 [Alteromonas ponticola]|uniref:Transposase family protein n=1 Tax=Alteromonas aquimaris TaxID=2998417 RepID=A0ABT3P8F9_9ALTE|nr:hypothetical protein [Alteromonas aquimaris]MCW8109034.1 hypothetical protein [Alteromonas aquimaris]